MTRRWPVVRSLLLILLTCVSTAAAQSSEEREITHLKGDLYRLRVGDQHTVFLVTPAGIVLVDPLSVDTALWLKEEFEQRFTAGRVSFVLHTNHHFDRAEGASIFAEEAEIVGQREFNSRLWKTRRGRMPAIAVSDRVRARDRNRDGAVTAEELYSRVRDVETIFDDNRFLSVGGRTIELRRAPSEATPENTIINFRTEQIAFAAEAPLLGSTPFQFGTWQPSELRRWLAAAVSLDFDTLMLADGTTIPKARILRLAAYVNDLVARVVEEYQDGKSAADFPETKVPGPYRSDAAFSDWRGNVSDIYRSVSIFRIDTMLGGLGHYALRDSTYCVSFATCSTGGLVPAVFGGVSVGGGRWAAAVELSIADESFTTTTSRFVDTEFALVETRTSYMVRYTRAAPGVSYRFLGGVSHTVGDRQGITRIKEGTAPFAGRHPLHSDYRRNGFTGGVDLVMGRGFGLVVPLRINYAARDESGTFPHRLDAQAGIALTFRLFQLID
jgi:glyoxylase-like metal-dependent hydrolase (beta-lactamase superfamily II)